MEALEALNLATLHVASAGMMLVGGGLWVFDIGSMAELRGRFRAAIGVEDREDKGADEEMEEWLATVLKRKEGKEKRRSKDGEEEEGR
ncbi:MAG: hypothetical protein M1832_003318 [Thelocarpon impressellum]|nr:MAG: hypothetical protein M1832_003318 [Thelocarpon impressellum]